MKIGRQAEIRLLQVIDGDGSAVQRIINCEGRPRGGRRGIVVDMDRLIICSMEPDKIHGDAALQLPLHAHVVLPLILATEIGVEVYSVDLSKAGIGIGTDIAIAETVTLRVASDRVVRLARGGGVIEPLNRLIPQGHGVEVGHNPDGDGGVELAYAGLHRRLVVAEHIVDKTDPWRPVFEAAHAFNHGAVNLREIARPPSEAARGRALRIDLRRQILPPHARRHRHPADVPGVGSVDAKVMIQAGLRIRRRVVHQDVQWYAVGVLIIGVAIGDVVYLGDAKGILYPKFDLVRTSHVGRRCVPKVPVILRVSVYSTRDAPCVQGQIQLLCVGKPVGRKRGLSDARMVKNVVIQLG